MELRLGNGNGNCSSSLAFLWLTNNDDFCFLKKKKIFIKNKLNKLKENKYKIIRNKLLVISTITYNKISK